MKKSSFEQQDLTKQVFYNTQYYQKEFEGYLFCYATFDQVIFQETQFIACNFNGAVFKNCIFQDVLFLYCHVEQTRFEDCEFDQVKVGQTDFEIAIVEDDSSINQRQASQRTLYISGYQYLVYHWPSRLRPATDRQPTQEIDKSGERSDGKPLVLLHGMTGHPLDFQPLVNLLQRPVYAVSLYGHEGTSFLSAYDLEPLEGTLASWPKPQFQDVTFHLMNLVTEILGVDRYQEFDLLGYSLGGRIALHLGFLWQEQSLKRPMPHLRTLYVIGASMGLQDTSIKEARKESDELWAQSLWQNRDVGAFLELWNKQPLLARVGEANPIEARRLKKIRKKHQAQGLALAFNVLGQGQMPPLHEQLTRLAIKTYWVYGTEDSKYARIAEEACLSNDLHEEIAIPNCGHAPHLENINSFWNMMKNLLY